MTEQEAIKEFEERLAIADYRDTIPKYYKAMELAVKDMKEIQQYKAIGTVEECRAAVEKQKAISREIIEGKYFCPKCHNLMPYPGYCGCGQRLY